MSRKSGGPAFPTDNEMQTGPSSYHYEGMTLRDWFAGQAMKALIEKLPLHDRLGELGINTPELEQIHGLRIAISQSAYDYADAMIAERSKP